MEFSALIPQYLKFEVLFCHINDFSSYLFKFLSVHNTYVQPWLWGYVFFAKYLCFLHDFHFFSRNFSIIFSQNLRIIFFANFCIFLRNRLKWNFAIKAKIFEFFARERNVKRSEMVAKNAKFSRNDFSFLLETLVRTFSKWV